MEVNDLNNYIIVIASIAALLAVVIVGNIVAVNQGVALGEKNMRYYLYYNCNHCPYHREDSVPDMEKDPGTPSPVQEREVIAPDV